MGRFFVGVLKKGVANARMLKDEEVIFEEESFGATKVKAVFTGPLAECSKGEEFFIADKTAPTPAPKFEIYKDRSGKKSKYA